MDWEYLAVKLNKAWILKRLMREYGLEPLSRWAGEPNGDWKTVVRCGKWRIEVLDGAARLWDVQTGWHYQTTESRLYSSIQSLFWTLEGYGSGTPADVGLVFSGGGARGAYEIGVWQALRDVGLDKYVTGLSGASIGAINSLLFASGDMEGAKELWESLSSAENRRISREHIAKFFRKFNLRREQNPLLTPLYNFAEDVFISQPELELHISRYAHGHGDFLRTRYRAFSAATPQEETLPRLAAMLQGGAMPDEGKADPHYISWATLSAHEIVQLTLASSAVPGWYEPIRFRGRKWFDGGLFDNTPVRPLYDCGFRNFIVVWLRRSPPPLRLPSDCEPCRMICFTPGPDFDDGPLAMLQISPELTRQRMEAGYQDALRQIGEQLPLIKEMTRSVRQNRQAR